jgi:predicted ATPase
MLAFALGLTAVVRLLRREHESGLRRAEEAIAVATEQGLPQWHAIGLIGRGFARAGLGQSANGIVDLRAGVAEFNETGAKMGNSEWLGFLAAAHAAAGQVDEALATLDQAEERVISAGERFAEAELRRLRGECVARRDVAAADCGEQWLRDALQCAREQGAKSPELRASTSLARLWRDQGKRAEARDLLAPIYGWFTEGFDTLDLKEAKALFDELAS